MPTTSAQNDFAASLRCLSPVGPGCLLLAKPVSLSLDRASSSYCFVTKKGTVPVRR